jgi:hypothetical protein
MALDRIDFDILRVLRINARLPNKYIAEKVGVAPSTALERIRASMKTRFVPVLVVSATLGALLKYQDDIARIEGSRAKELLNAVQAELRAALKAIQIVPDLVRDLMFG